jgi:hypothetical protein
MTGSAAHDRAARATAPTPPASTSRRVAGAALLLSALLVAGLGCSGGATEAGTDHQGALFAALVDGRVADGTHDNAVHATRPAVDPAADTGVAAGHTPAPAPFAVTGGADPLEPGVLKTVTATLVVGRTGPGGEPFEVSLRTPGAPAGHSRRFGRQDLATALRLRSPDLSQYPCTACHTGAQLTPGAARIHDAHPDITSRHPAETGAACRSCHAPADVELLTLQSGDVATLDHAYRLCAQCHFREADAWAAGAHGKRLDGWQGRRVVMNCTDCHDPHEPALEPRMPFRPPRLHRSRQP